MSFPSVPLPEIKTSQIVHSGFFDLKVDELQIPNGPKRDYTVLMTKCSAAVVLAETDDGKLIILKEYRHPVRHWLLSCPGGRLDAGESPIDGAKRELLEETGYAAEEFIYMNALYPLPAVCDQQLHYVLAKKAKLVQLTQHEPMELIQTELMTYSELIEQISSGALTDGNLCAALFLKSIYDHNRTR